VSVARWRAKAWRKHPWSLGGGGASELKELLEERCDRRLGDVVAAVGRTTVAGEDDIWIADTPGTWARQGLAVRAVPLVLGECVRDWTITGCPEILYPYETLGGPAIDDRDPLVRHLWRWRVTLQNRTVFGKSFKDGKRPWWEHLEHYSEKLRTPLGIAFAFVATHNHFVLDRGGKVFKQTAPIIKLPPDATEDDHLALLAYLNSSTACFWMKQVCMNKGATSDKGVLQADEDKFRYEFDGTKLRLMPVPPLEVLRPLIPLARALTEECTTVSAESYRAVLDAAGDRDAAAAGWARLDDANAQMRTRAVAFQEEIDWAVYSIIGFEGAPHYVPHATVGTEEAGYEPDERPFASSMRPSLIDRIGAIGGSAQLQFLESAEFKRRWYRSQGKFNAKAVTDDTLHVVAYDLFVLAAAERAAQAAAMIAPAGAIIRGASHALDVARGVALSVLGSATTPEEDLATRLAADAVPFLAAYRYTDAGLEKLSAWERTWDLQRREDAREDVGTIPVPPKYAQGDFREGSYWRLRGKLDVPKERFISYPGCEGDDGEPLYGWAGWDHKQRAMALMTLYQERKTQDGWDKERLTPMLAGLRELLPWLRQWHRDVDPDFGMSMADYFAGLYDAERAALGVSDQELAAWRPQAKRGGRNKA
jgi:hypothetical protein